MNPSAPADFLARARHEARRYGSDPWVLVRELIQNARDAGATRVEFTTSCDRDRERISCRDNGSGMTFEHARSYLFTLYASSKTDRRTAGRFGIGFWSVLRFAPDVITIRSRPDRGEGWEVRLDGSLEKLERQPSTMSGGTEVVLERPPTGTDLRDAVHAAVLSDAPFVRARKGPRSLLDVVVDGEPVRAEFDLPAPSARFSRRGLRGAVGLGSVPKVEVYAHGLKVREAAGLDELLLSHRGRRASVPDSGDCFSPRLKIDSSRLKVLMARGDAREDRALKRLVAVGHRELRRLISAELDRHVGSSWLTRMLGWFDELWSNKGLRVVAGAIAMITLLAGLMWLLPRPKASGDASKVLRIENREPAIQASRPGPYSDLTTRYRGPRAAGLASVPPAIDLEYRPHDRRPFFAALVVEGLAADGRFFADSPQPSTSYSGALCSEGCLEVELVIEAAGRWLPLPVATGHVIDPSSVTLDGRPLVLRADLTGRPIVRIDGNQPGRLRYRSSLRAAGEVAVDPGWPSLPVDVKRAVADIRLLEPAERPLAAADWVRSRIRYDVSSEVAAAYLMNADRDQTLFERSLEIGRGDCDVQNAMVAAMLAEAGLTARLAIGWLGYDGRAVGLLHAWVEYLDETGTWSVVDASAGTSPLPRALSRQPEGALEPTRRRFTWAIPVAAAGALVLIALVVWAFGRFGWRRSYRAGAGTDFSGLLQGAAARPEAFASVRALFSRRILKLLAGGRLSLSDARIAARSGRLSCGSRRSPLAVRAATGGGLVVDLAHREGAAVAQAFAAIDLDRWNEVLDRAHQDPLTATIESRLSRLGERCQIRLAEGLGEEIALLDGESIGLGASCWIVLDQDGALWQAVRKRSETEPAGAALLLADAVVNRLGVSGSRRGRLLRDLAAAALAEAAEGAA